MPSERFMRHHYGASGLRSPLEVINSASRVKLSADPNPEMALIMDAARACIRHHPTLALETWRRNIATIRTALENVERIYKDAERDTPQGPAEAPNAEARASQ